MSVNERQIRSRRAAAGGLRLLNPNHDSPDNKRLHVYFNHSGLVFLLPTQKRPVQQLLKAVWSHFGTVTDAYYHDEFSFGFVSYANHDQAELALSGMKNSASLKQAIAVATSQFADPIAMKKIADRLFTIGPGGSMVQASRAASKRKPHGGPIY